MVVEKSLPGHSPIYPDRIMVTCDWRGPTNSGRELSDTASLDSGRGGPATRKRFVWWCINRGSDASKPGPSEGSRAWCRLADRWSASLLGGVNYIGIAPPVQLSIASGFCTNCRIWGFHHGALMTRRDANPWGLPMVFKASWRSRCNPNNVASDW